MGSFLQIDERDNVAVALAPLAAGQPVDAGKETAFLVDDIPAKQKFALQDLATGTPVRMYGAVVGRVRVNIPRGGLLTTWNVEHDTAPYSLSSADVSWTGPDISRWRHRTFDGFHRADGQVGTRNYWLVFPLVFCENRNVEALKEAFEAELGYGRPQAYREQVRHLAQQYRQEHASAPMEPEQAQQRLFPNLDGVQFLLHQGGCGGTRQDSQALCGLLAGYVKNPNVAGATVLSLGCQQAQVENFEAELRRRGVGEDKPVLLFDQQKSGLESDMMATAIAATFEAMAKANMAQRTPAPLSKLTVGLKCGGSDGFSGISANPTLGRVSDMLVTLGGRTILAEFPELHGAEQNIIDRCANRNDAERFVHLMQTYNARAKAVQSGFEMNPSPGNIRDGLLTDAMKSAGAARKSGTSPVRRVLDYPEYATEEGLNLLCTPGNDVEAVTAQVGAGANLVLFTTGLGTPTGNPVAPVLKISTNTRLAEHMPDIIDMDTGPIVSGDKTPEAMGDDLLNLIIEVASGRCVTKAETLKQNDFIPWKRGVSL